MRARRVRLTTSLDCIAGIGSTALSTKRLDRCSSCPTKEAGSEANGPVTDGLSTIYIEQTIIQVRSDPDFLGNKTLFMHLLFIASHRHRSSLFHSVTTMRPSAPPTYCFWLLSLASESSSGRLKMQARDQKQKTGKRRNARSNSLVKWCHKWIKSNVLVISTSS